MRILIVGSGGREHAIAWSIASKSTQAVEIFCAPGNAGISRVAECVPISATDISSLATFALEKEIGLTIVGGEGPLAAGIVDAFELKGLRTAGPTLAAARLESSKVFAKEFMSRHGIPTAEYQTANSPEEAIDRLHSAPFLKSTSRVVVKADGLAAGKGVVVAESIAEAEQAIRDLMIDGTVGLAAGKSIVIEEALTGPEVSLLVFSDGTDFVLMPAARDHKRIGENDTGPNTGGMGVITSPDIIDAATLEFVIKRVVEPTLAGARTDGFPFRGILFVGLMLTQEGPRVLEYNVRFGDPETQAILARLESDPVEIFDAIAGGGLTGLQVRWKEGASACVVLASEGYPSSPVLGDRISGIESEPEAANIHVFHAGTTLSDNGEIVTAGGRVLGVAATAPTLEVALKSCYAEIQRINWRGMQYRRDIGRFSVV
jgi:phosphoribosylamine--glycine ligase